MNVDGNPTFAPGRLLLVPTQLSAPWTPEAILPPLVCDQVRSVRHVIAENAKTARAFLKDIKTPCPLQEIDIQEIDKHADASALAAAESRWLAPLLAGHDVLLVSEAGAPGVADPGAHVVAAAHRAQIRVIPLVGPSSLLLALMASGLNGQAFAFHGYLPQERAARVKAILDSERESRNRQQTQLYIETPYRNQALLADLLSTLAPTTQLCIASDLTGAAESVTTRTISVWRKSTPTLTKLPTVFLFLAGR